MYECDNRSRYENGKRTDQSVLDALIDLREELSDAREPTLTDIGERLGMNRNTVGSVMRRLVGSGAVIREGVAGHPVFVPTRLEAHA